MENLENPMREVAKKLLSEKKVDLIIGFEQGTLPLRATPCFVDKVEDVKGSSGMQVATPIFQNTYWAEKKKWVLSQKVVTHVQ